MSILFCILEKVKINYDISACFQLNMKIYSKDTYTFNIVTSDNIHLFCNKAFYKCLICEKISYIQWTSDISIWYPDFVGNLKL